MAGYSKTTLIQKLGIKAGSKVFIFQAPAEVAEILTPLPEGVKVLKKLGSDVDYIHYFAESISLLESAFAGLKAGLAKDGMLWISWRKGKKGTDLTENDVRRIALAHGLVDVKVCAIDETWSGLKLVYRVKDR